jgi:hypothetical protein
MFLLHPSSQHSYQVESPVQILQEAGWAAEPVLTHAENLTPTGIQSPDLQPLAVAIPTKLPDPPNEIKMPKRVAGAGKDEAEERGKRIKQGGDGRQKEW